MAERGDGDGDAALAPVAVGPLLAIADGELEVTVAPQAGGRLAQIRCDGVDWLLGPDGDAPPMIAWGCFPMVPWAGRLRDGRFRFDDRDVQLPRSLGAHAIHGVGFGLPWTVEARFPRHLELSLQLPTDARWPFGGRCRQRIEVAGRRLRLQLEVQADALAMPVELGWHPWFRTPERLHFNPIAMYPRDGDGIAVRPLCAPKPPPLDDCFVNDDAVLLEAAGHRLRLTSDCRHWVLFDGHPGATCLEPQTGPPDAFNLEPRSLQPGETLQAQFLLEWL
jgi:aldose 1-epimerase